MKKPDPKAQKGKHKVKQIIPLLNFQGKTYHDCGRKDWGDNPRPECELGKLANQKKSDEEAGCPWWIQCPEHNYSFWSWCRHRSYEDGHMDPLMQNEIAHLLGCSSTKVHFILKEAIEKLKQSKHLHILADLHGVPLDSMDISNSNLSEVLPDDSDFGESGF